MARTPNYGFEKRRKEQERRQKKEAKLQRRQEEKLRAQEQSPAPPTDGIGDGEVASP